VADQIAALLAITSGVNDAIAVDQVGKAECSLREILSHRQPDLCSRIEAGEKLSASDRDSLTSAAREATEHLS